MAIRNQTGVWCGYVGVPPSHPLYGKGYEELDLTVHGGLTYASACALHICHTPKPGEPDNVWWFGFDCGHGGDLTPAFITLYERCKLAPSIFEETYKPLSYVKAEVERLAKQLQKG